MSSSGAHLYPFDYWIVKAVDLLSLVWHTHHPGVPRYTARINPFEGICPALYAYGIRKTTSRSDSAAGVDQGIKLKCRISTRECPPEGAELNAHHGACAVLGNIALIIGIILVVVRFLMIRSLATAALSSVPQ